MRNHRFCAFMITNEVSLKIRNGTNKYVRLRGRTFIHACRSYVHTPRELDRQRRKNTVTPYHTCLRDSDLLTRGSWSELTETGSTCVFVRLLDETNGTSRLAGVSGRLASVQWDARSCWAPPTWLPHLIQIYCNTASLSTNLMNIHMRTVITLQLCCANFITGPPTHSVGASIVCSLSSVVVVCNTPICNVTHQGQHARAGQ